MASPLRRSKRSRPKDPATILDGSPFQSKLKWTVESGGLGGMKRLCRLIERASDRDISSIDSAWSPLALAVMICGGASTTTSINEEFEDELLTLIKTCSRRGISVDQGCRACISKRLIRPLVLAAYHGLHRSVEALLDAGATPDLADGEGKTVLHAALINPFCARTWRTCDRLTAELLFRRNIITSSLRKWKISSGENIYINCADHARSALLTAIRHKNLDAATLLCERGAHLTDHDYFLVQRFYNISYRDWLPFLSEVATISRSSSAPLLKSKLGSWSEALDFTFPPTWKVAVALCGSCGLPEDIFRAKIVPFLPRHWFYTDEQLKCKPPRLGASLGTWDIDRRDGWMRKPSVNTVDYSGQL